MNIQLKTGGDIRCRNRGAGDVSFDFDPSQITYGPDVFPGVFGFRGAEPEVENITPEIGIIGFGGEVIKVSSGVAFFVATSGGVRKAVAVDLSDPAVPPTFPVPPPPPPYEEPVDPTPPPPPPEPPVYPEIINSLIANTEAALTSLLDGVPGGAQSMDLWASRDPITKTYVRNPNMWASSLVSQLTGCVAYKSPRAQQSYGGILISPRHVLYCDHAHPHAAHTWPVNYAESRPTTLQFVLADNTVVEGIQLAQTQRRTSRSQPGAYIPADWPEGATSAPDLCVAVLDRDMQALGCHVMPIPDLPLDDLGWIQTLNIPTYNVTQGYERLTNTIPPTPASAYPQQNNAMLAIGRGSRSGTAYEHVDYTVWDGDSGTPAMLLYNGVMYLERIILTSTGGGVQPARVLDHLNSMITVADADAIARGVLAAATGITITPVSIF